MTSQQDWGRSRLTIKERRGLCKALLKFDDLSAVVSLERRIVPLGLLCWLIDAVIGFLSWSSFIFCTLKWRIKVVLVSQITHEASTNSIAGFHSSQSTTLTIAKCRFAAIVFLFAQSSASLLSSIVMIENCLSWLSSLSCASQCPKTLVYAQGGSALSFQTSSLSADREWICLRQTSKI